MSSRRLKIAVKDHTGKGRPFISALHAAGHEFVSKGPADLLLIDIDPPLGLHKHLIDRYAEMGAKIFLYPHSGGGPILSYDSLWEPDPHVISNMVASVGHAEYLRRIDYPSSTHVVGWPYCEMRPFRANENVKKVIFAPNHPNGDGSMTNYQRDMNSDVFRQLLDTPFELTVRHIGTLEQNGLWKVPGVKYTRASLIPATDDIDRTDAVVAASGTFPTLALARGIPTVFYGQDRVALGIPDEEPVLPNRMELYWDYARYPIDVEDGDLETLIRTAALSDAPIAAWRRRFVGEEFDPLGYASLVERLVLNGPDPVRIDDTRRFTTLAFVDELLENPALLRTYAEAFGPDDDASLILWAPGVPGPKLLEMAEGAIAASGVDGDRLGDILLTPLPGSPATDQAFTERVDLVLTEWPATGSVGALARMGAGDPRALRAAGVPGAALVG